jgi:integrase
VRVSEKGQRTFILIARYPGSPNPTRRALGEYPAISLEKARTRARAWRDLIDQGIDPKAYEVSLRREEIRKQETTFGAVAEEFLERHVSSQRRGKDTAREIRNELISQWGDRAIAGITRQDVVSLIDAIARRPAPYLAHVVLGHIRSLFNWAINRGTYGLEASPCDRLKPAALIGAKQPRQRILSDTEIAALWQASEAIGYPFGPLYRLLLLTGARKSEVAGARWSEFDLNKRVWVVPPERFKSNATHMVPLSDQAMIVLLSVPHFTKGDYLFSTTLGARPVGGFSKAKARLDSLMKAPPWVIHDIRRTVRTRLASLRVPDMVAEISATVARAFSASTISTHIWMRCERLWNCGQLDCETSSLRHLRMW